VEKTEVEAAEDIIASAASESTQQEEYKVDFVQPYVEPKRESQVRGDKNHRDFFNKNE